MSSKSDFEYVLKKRIKNKEKKKKKRKEILLNKLIFRTLFSKLLDFLLSCKVFSASNQHANFK